MSPVEHSDVVRQVALMHVAKGTQGVTQTCPNTFRRVAMHFTETIVIVVTGELAARVAHSHMLAAGFRDVIMGRGLIGIQQHIRNRIRLRLNRGLLCARAERQANSPRFPPHREWTDDR